MLRRLAALLLLPLLAAPLRAEPDPAPLDLTGARILASPGWPKALRSFLPPGREVEPLALPLPPGPVLILGLLDRDPVAREVATTLVGLKAGDDLGGGYLVSASREGDRPVVLILGTDAAALAAARFELETFIPAGKESEPRSVEFQQPDEQGGVRIAPGRRNVKPRYRIRAAAGLGPGESVLDIAAAHANRLWVNEKTTDRDLALMREHGVEPVVVAPIDLSMPKETLLAWQQRGVRRFVADFRRPGGRLPPPIPDGPSEAAAAKAMADFLRAGGLEELLVVPSSLSDDTAARLGAPPDLRGIPEAVIGWAGPTDQPLEITHAQAVCRAKEAGVPVALVETWMEAAAGEPLRIPSMPRGRAADLGDVLAGVLVLPGPGSADALATAWAPSTDPDVSPDLGDLMGACVLNAKHGPTFLIESAACLEQTLLGRYIDAPWMRGLPQRLREGAAALPETGATLLARWSAESVTVDGRLEETCWSSTPPQKIGGGFQLRAVSDGRRLVVGVRIPDEAGARDCTLRFRTAVGELPFDVVLPILNVVATPVLVATANRGGAQEFGVALDHYILRGAPYPTRQFGFHAVATMTPQAGGGFVTWFAPTDDDQFVNPKVDTPPRGALLVVR